MKLGIFGHHPELQPGFESAMSLNEAVGFAKAGHAVVLYIPRHPEGRYSTDRLERYGFDFEIREIDHQEDYGRDLDALIWQAYKPDLERLFPSKRRFAVTKNFPRYAANSSETYRTRFLKGLDKFDSMAMSLTEDVKIAQRLDPGFSSRVGYVPRGFNQDWFGKGRKSKVPSFACDAAVKAPDGGAQAVRHMSLLFEELRRRGVRHKVSAARGAAGLLKADYKVKHLPLLKFYEQFFDPAWIYLPCDFEHSVHSQRKDFDEKGRKVYLGMFENQIVEAQFAGAIPLFEKGQVDPELVFDRDICECSSYRDIDELTTRALAIIENYESYGARAKRYARDRYGTDTMVSNWMDLLQGSESVSQSAA